MTDVNLLERHFKTCLTDLAAGTSSDWRWDEDLAEDIDLLASACARLFPGCSLESLQGQLQTRWSDLKSSVWAKVGLDSVLRTLNECSHELGVKPC